MNTVTPIQNPFWLDKEPVAFPPTDYAMTDPDGLLAVGGDLTPEWLLAAYRQGIFPWFNPGEPTLWWTPNPRSVVFIDDLKISRSLRQSIKKYTKHQRLNVTFDSDFKGVIQQCATIDRSDQDGTWITDDIFKAYVEMHQRGHAHSVEVWLNNELVGGLYGLAIGKMFFGESMFAKASDASKIALVALALQLNQWGFKLIDTQIETPHLNSLGACNIERPDFEELIERQCASPFPPQKWALAANWQDWIADHLQHQSKTK